METTSVSIHLSFRSFMTPDQLHTHDNVLLKKILLSDVRFAHVDIPLDILLAPPSKQTVQF